MVRQSRKTRNDLKTKPPGVRRPRRATEVPTSTRYKCKSCGFVEAMEDIDPYDTRIPSLNPRIAKRDVLWRRCPDDGPDWCQLVDPLSDEPKRWRDTVGLREGSVRLCSPIVAINRREPDGAMRKSVGPALTIGQRVQEFFLDKASKNRRRQSRMDLRDAADAFVLSHGGRPYEVNGLWMLPIVHHWDSDEWGYKLRQIGYKDPAARTLASQVVAALAPHRDSRGVDDSRTRIYLPVDLRIAVEPQLERHALALSELRDWLHRLATGRRGSRPEARHVWRDTYVYLLARHLRWNSAKIGDKEFAEMPKQSRERLVAQIVRRVKKSLASKSRRI